jgi:hypothetical protein
MSAVDESPEAEMAGWRRSSPIGAPGGACVEVAGCPAAVAVRDRRGDGTACATVSADAWQAFVDGVIEGSMR